jgi:sugar O-acyltransferase (sialic acid O-acetyltransferase NeuD family)
MRPLILVAASGLAREAAATVELLPDYDVLGCLDDDETLWGTKVGSMDVLGGIDNIHHHPESDLLICAGKGASRRAIVARLEALGVLVGRYPTVVHPSVHVPSSCAIGAGSIVLANVSLTADVQVGRHVVVMPQCTLTHDVVLQDFATLTAGVSLGGNVTIGEAAYVGMNSSVRERLSVGAGAVLGMGSVLLHDLPDHQTWAGVPARALTTSTKAD